MQEWADYLDKLRAGEESEGSGTQANRAAPLPHTCSRPESKGQALMKLYRDLSIGQKADCFFAHGLRRAREERQVVAGGRRGDIGYLRHAMNPTVSKSMQNSSDLGAESPIRYEEDRIITEVSADAGWPRD